MKYIFLILIYFLSISSSFALSLKLEFQIDEDFLICHTLSKSTNTLFHKEMMAQFPKELKFLEGIDELTPAVIIRENLRLQKMLKAAKSSSSYPQLLAETKIHLEQTQAEWNSNYSSTFSFMTSLTKMEMNKTIMVLITHPKVFQGRYLGDNVIAWGRKSEWKNYSTVYLWHEILHSYLKYNDKSHALIELMTDDALRVFLNGGKYPPFSEDGHERLRTTKQWIYDHYWTAYLVNKSKNIIQLEDEILVTKADACSSDSDCKLVDNPECTGETSKISIRKETESSLKYLNCKKRIYRFIDHPGGVTFTSSCFKNVCVVNTYAPKQSLHKPKEK